MVVVSICAVEPDAWSHELHHDRHRVGAVVVDHSTRTLSPHDGICVCAEAMVFTAPRGSDRAGSICCFVDALSCGFVRPRIAHADSFAPRVFLFRCAHVSWSACRGSAWTTLP